MGIQQLFFDWSIKSQCPVAGRVDRGGTLRIPGEKMQDRVRERASMCVCVCREREIIDIKGFSNLPL